MESSVWWSLSQAVKTKGTAWNPAALGMRSAGCAPRPDAGAHGAGVATAPSQSESTRWCLRLLVRS